MKKDLCVCLNLDVSVFKHLFDEEVFQKIKELKKCIDNYSRYFQNDSLSDLAKKRFRKTSTNFEDLKFSNGLAMYKKQKYTGVAYHSIDSSTTIKLTYSQGLLVKSSRQGTHNFSNIYQYSENKLIGILTYNEKGELLTVSKKNNDGFTKSSNKGKLILKCTKINDNIFQIIRQSKESKILEFKNGFLTRTITKKQNSKSSPKINLYRNGQLIQSSDGKNVKFYANSKLVSSVTKTIWSKEKNITDTTIKNFDSITGRLVSITRNFNGENLKGITSHKSETALFDQCELPIHYESELVSGQFIKTFISQKGKIVTQTIKNGQILLNEEGDFYRANSLKTA